MQSSPSADSALSNPGSTKSSANVALGIGVVGVLIVLAVVGGAAEHGSGSADLRRGPASVVLSVLLTLAGLAGVASLMLLIWGLVTRNRRSLDGAAARRHSPILVAGAMMAIIALLAALLALAARRRHPQAAAGLGAGLLSGAHRAANTLPFNTAASVATSGVVIGIVAALVVAKVVRSMGWRRALRRLRPFSAAGGTEAEETGLDGTDLEELGMDLRALTVPGPDIEPDPRRAVIGCYLQMLEVGARRGPDRRRTETPTEYLRRMLATTRAGAAPATSLTGLFERACYSERPVDESMRSAAITALDALRHDLQAGSVH